MSDINKKSLRHLADLARLDLSEKEEENFAADLGKIFSHFEELQALDTGDILPMTGPRSAGGFGPLRPSDSVASEASGTDQKNVFREDGGSASSLGHERVVEQFPDKDGHYLKVPPIFTE